MTTHPASLATDTPSELQPVTALTWRNFFLWLLGFLTRRTVHGHSMAPTLSAGESILINSKQKLIHPLPCGSIVYLKHPITALPMIKRIYRHHELHQTYEVIGDNHPMSTDSRHFGPVNYAHIKGIVVCSFP
jgi:nickel-type superoxide dismutase maturation protease